MATDRARMNLTTRFFIYAPFALFIVLAIGVSIRWFSEASAFSGRLDRLNGHTLMPGVTLHFTSKQISGFPFRMDAIFKNLEIDVETRHGPSSWHSEDFALHRLTYGADTTLFEAAGRQRLTWTDTDGRHHELPLAIGSLHASASQSGAGLERFDLDAVALGSPDLSAESAQLHLRTDKTEDAIDLFVTVNGVRLQPKLSSAFGEAIDHLLFSGRATPRTSLGTLLQGRIDWPCALSSAQRAGGQLRIDQVEIAFERLDATGRGTLVLDTEGRPAGILDFKVARFARFVAAEREGGARKGLARALADRASKAGSDAMGRLGIVLGAKDGILYAADEPAGALTPVY
jgi:hypothetical protein